MTSERKKEIAENEAKMRKHIANLTDNFIKNLAVTTGIYDCITDPYDKLNNGDEYSSVMPDLERFAKLIIEETLKQVDERTYGRGENQWYYDDDKRWIRLHFGYGEIHDNR